MPPNDSHSNGTPAVKTVGYIGLGNAGISMASNIPKAGYDLVVHDADNSKADKAASEWPSTRASGGRPEAFADCEVIITMLPNGKIVKDVLLGKDGIAKALKPGRCTAFPDDDFHLLCSNSFFAESGNRHDHSRYLFIVPI